MTPLRLAVNAIVGGFLLFAWKSLAPNSFGGLLPEGGFALRYLSCCAEALIACWFLVLVAPRVRTFAWRVVFVATLGLFASLVAELPLGRAAQEVLGFALAGCFLAWRMATFRPVPRQPPRLP